MCEKVANDAYKRMTYVALVEQFRRWKLFPPTMNISDTLVGVLLQRCIDTVIQVGCALY